MEIGFHGDKPWLYLGSVGSDICPSSGIYGTRKLVFRSARCLELLAVEGTGAFWTLDISETQEETLGALECWDGVGERSSEPRRVEILSSFSHYTPVWIAFVMWDLSFLEVKFQEIRGSIEMLGNETKINSVFITNYHGEAVSSMTIVGDGMVGSWFSFPPLISNWIPSSSARNC